MSPGRKITDVVLSGDQSHTTPGPPPADAHASPLDCYQTLPDKNGRVDAVWKHMNKGISTEKLNSILKKSTSVVNRSKSKPSTSSWMTVLGLGPKKNSPSLTPVGERQHSSCCGDEAKKLAAAALSAVKDPTTCLAWGKVELREVRDFAGEAIEVKKLVDAGSKEASKGPSAVDAVLEQIRKKPKLSVLDKTKKDWGEFKEENRLDEELETYKKSGNQYLEKVSFLERADYREFERERDARLANANAKRKSDMRDDD